MNTQLTLKDLAQKLQVSERTLENLIAQGDAPPHYRVGRARRWDPAVVEVWIKGRTKRAKENSTTK